MELKSWGDDEQTLALYQGAGFVLTKQEIIYRRDAY